MRVISDKELKKIKQKKLEKLDRMIVSGQLNLHGRQAVMRWDL